jgi:histidine triad (HIT) family protein
VDCLFCKIAQRVSTADVVHDGDDIMAFRDISPQAPTHILIIPKRHIATINDVDSQDVSLLGRMVLTAQQLAAETRCDESGYRLIYNVNQDAGQAVFHIHLHLLGGRQMTWPPG